LDVAVSGSTGLVGTALVPALEAAGHRVARLVRPETAAPSGSDTIAWDVGAGTIDAASLEGVDAVVHLGAVPIGEGRWTAQRKARILRSRTEGTALLARTLSALQRPPHVFVSASAIGVYGAHRGDAVLTEDDPGRDDDFPAAVCHRWEAATEPASETGIRVVHLRSGLVLAAQGGLLQRLLLPFRLGLGGRVGSGDQWMSWIALEDELGAIELLLASELAGPVNVVGPVPVRQRDFAATLGRVLHRPVKLPTPLLPLRLLYTTEMVNNTLLASQRVVPERLAATGYTFRQPELEGALRSILDRPAP